VNNSLEGVCRLLLCLPHSRSQDSACARTSALSTQPQPNKQNELKFKLLHEAAAARRVFLPLVQLHTYAEIKKMSSSFICAPAETVNIYSRVVLAVSSSCVSQPAGLYG
jgi:hypothetical protein